MADYVNRLALTTGSSAVPVHKRLLGYRHEPDKFATARLTRGRSAKVVPHPVQECPVQLEAEVAHIRPFAVGDARMAIPSVAVELRIVAVHVDDSLLMDANEHRIDPDRWRPMFMSFRYLYGRGPRQQPLARGPEEAYAPWKQGVARRLGSKVLSAWSQYKYGQEPQPEDSKDQV